MREGAEGIRRVLGYARVSSVEQALGTSLEDQQDAIRAYAKARGLGVAKFYVEAESAVHEKIEKREQIRLLLADAHAGDLIVCDKLDRWSRDAEFTYRSIREIHEKGVRFYAVGDRCDPSTRDGDTMLSVRILVAREEHKRIKERMVGTRKLWRDRGYYTEGRTPPGYTRKHGRGHKGVEKNELVPDDAMVPGIVEAFRVCARGGSVGDVVAYLEHARPERGWDKKGVHNLLRSRVYLGEIKDSRGVWIRAKHPAIVDPSLFDRAQAGLAGRRWGGAKPKGDSLTDGWLLRQVATCARCGGKIGAAYGGKSARYPTYVRFYYICKARCRGSRYMLVAEQDAPAAEMLLARLTELREELARGTDPKPPAPVADFSAMKAKLERRRDGYLEAFADQLMNKEKLREVLAKVDAERTSVEAREADARKRSPVATQRERRETLRHVAKIQEAWRKASVAIRRAILREFANSVQIQHGKPPRIRWRTTEEIAGDLRS